MHRHPERRYPNEEAAYDAWEDLYEEKGEEGFLALLRDLAPFLESPLLILCANSDHSDCVVFHPLWHIG
jgi:hypothetical protein